jgi:monofunctional biosynthetic peptidoglycan transglycosylase
LTTHEEFSSQDEALKEAPKGDVPPKLPTTPTEPVQSEAKPSAPSLHDSTMSSNEPLQPQGKVLGGKSFSKKVLSFVWKFTLFCLVFPVLQVVILRFVDPPFSTMMAYQALGHLFSGESVLWKQTNLNKSEASPFLYMAILAGEDQKFYLHHGFDMEEIHKAEEAHAKHPNRPMRGASTITQQTAKNLFLPPWHSFIRKGVEAYYTVLMEFLWPKDRILEVYGNIAEFAPNVYGAEAGAEFHFKRHAKNLTQQQAAQMAAVLPNPERWSASHPSPYIQRRAQRIVRQMHGIPTEEEESNDEPD